MLVVFCSLFCLVWSLVVFFKQKTAYEMRISDWSSDWCSSDLQRGIEPVERPDVVDDRVLRRELQHHCDVAELQVGVDEDHGLVAAPRQHHCQVRGDEGLAGATLCGEHGDRPPALAVGLEQISLDRLERLALRHETERSAGPIDRRDRTSTRPNSSH